MVAFTELPLAIYSSHPSMTLMSNEQHFTVVKLLGLSGLPFVCLLSFELLALALGP